jgi:restriction system protein
LNQPPAFLEQLVLTLLCATGYGGRARAPSTSAAPATAGSMVSSGREFAGWTAFTCRPSATPPTTRLAVPGERGVFTTTSRFSADARGYVQRITSRLIDGRRLAELMILHNVGMQEETTVVLKRLDMDFFTH